jgi:K+-transporting ATPase c subunit
MIPYLRSTLLTAAAFGLAIAVAWPDVQAAAGVPVPEPQTSAATNPAYFLALPATPDGKSTPTAHTTSATLDEQYTRNARLFRVRNGLDASAPVPSVHLSAAVRSPRTITLEEAVAQVERIATARGLPRSALVALVEQYTEYGPMGLGAPVVNVPLLNLALDALE